MRLPPCGRSTRICIVMSAPLSLMRQNNWNGWRLSRTLPKVFPLFWRNARHAGRSTGSLCTAMKSPCYSNGAPGPCDSSTNQNSSRGVSMSACDTRPTESSFSRFPEVRNARSSRQCITATFRFHQRKETCQKTGTHLKGRNATPRTILANSVNFRTSPFSFIFLEITTDSHF